MGAPLAGLYAPLALRLDPCLIMSASGMTPDPWQAELIRDTVNWWLLLCTRQGGKTQAISALALATALNRKGALVLILTPSERQSKEVLRCVSQYYLSLYGVPVRSDAITALKMELPNGSRILHQPTDRAFAPAVHGLCGRPPITVGPICPAQAVSGCVNFTHPSCKDGSRRIAPSNETNPLICDF